MSIRRLFQQWQQWRRFKKLTAKQRSIVVYSEDKASWAHLGTIVEELLDRFDGQICYVTSDPDDPRLESDNPKLLSFYLGDGAIRTYFFMTLKADILITTMPDLETFHIKRSQVAPVHYVYVFHSMVSTHMVYRQGAFDHYDTILCSGPHHVEEIRATESAYELQPKALVEHGYARLDTILSTTTPTREAEDALRVLIAPSWGPQGLLETYGPELTTLLLDAGFQVTVRPHPSTAKHWPDSLTSLREACGNHPNFVLETDISSQDSYLKSDVMISDWSGAALEYAFGLERPVIFIDVPRKVNNPEYERIPCKPIEVAIRHELGQVVPVDQLDRVADEVRRLCADPQAYRDRIQKLRSKTIFNIGHSGEVGADAILATLCRLQAQANPQ